MFSEINEVEQRLKNIKLWIKSARTKSTANAKGKLSKINV